MKKNRIFLLCFMLLTTALSSSVFAQRKKMNIADYEKRKMEYIKKEAGLSDEEAAKFFPVFNELAKKKFDLHKGHREQIEKMKVENADMTSEEYRKLFENDMEVKLKEVALEKMYSEQLEKILSPEKLYKAQQADKKFMQQEVTRFREK
mgnify:FL=1